MDYILPNLNDYLMCYWYEVYDVISISVTHLVVVCINCDLEFHEFMIQLAFPFYSGRLLMSATKLNIS